MPKSSNRIIKGTRRNNNEGCITQRKDGRWAGIITVGRDENGKPIRKSVYGKSRMEVSSKMVELTGKMESTNYDYVSKNTFGQLMKEWLLVFKKNQVTTRTFENDLTNFKLHIEPKVGNMKIDEVNSMVIQKILNSMLEKNFSLSFVKKVKFLFNQFFNYAVDNNLASSNPVMKTRVRSNDRKIYDGENKYKAIPVEVRGRFLAALETHRFLKPLCMCMMFAGLRAGEALALKWQSIDFDKKVIKVERGLTSISKFDENGNVLERVTVIGETKTACSVREVPMPDILVDALKGYIIEQEVNSDFYNTNLTSQKAFVFANNDGSVRSYSGTKKIFSRFLEKHNLKQYNIHFHGLRHTYSNMLFKSNQNPKVIQALLGHKSVKTTITTYNSVDKSYFKQATDVLNNQYSSEMVSKFSNTPSLQKPKSESILNNITDDELDELELLLERRRRNREQDAEI